MDRHQKQPMIMGRLFDECFYFCVLCNNNNNKQASKQNVGTIIIIKMKNVQFHLFDFVNQKRWLLLLFFI